MDGSLFVGAIEPKDPVRPKSMAQPRWSLKHLLIAGLVVVLLAGTSIYANYYWQTGRFLVTTDDAYVEAHSVLISPKVSGYISQVLVDDNQTVRVGELLARIDPRDYQTALDQARADVAAAAAAIETLDQQILQQALTVEQARELVVSDRAALVFSQQEFERYTELEKNGFGTVQRAQQARADIRQKAAALEHEVKGVGLAEQQIRVLQAQLVQARATLAQQQALARQAELNLGYTAITAPVDGTVGVRTLEVGEYVQPGTQLMAAVPLQAVYITANYKETQLTDVRPGQPVTVKIDTYPDIRLHGRVDSVAPASGQAFALLPPDNATGNFTKIVQRIPVKIRVDADSPINGLLRPGMSVEPIIDTRSASRSNGRTP